MHDNSRGENWEKIILEIVGRDLGRGTRGKGPPCNTGLLDWDKKGGGGLDMGPNGIWMRMPGRWR